MRLRSVGQAGPDPARVKRPREGNVSRVESAALEWECSAIYAVASGFSEYFEQQDCSAACWLQMRTKYLSFADWKYALNPARKNSYGCYTNIEL